MMVLLSAGIAIVLPLVFIATLWFGKFKTKLEWLFDALITVLIVAWLFQSGPWSWFSFYFRYMLVILLLIALIFSWRKVKEFPFKMKYKDNQKIAMGVNMFLILIFGFYNIGILTSYSTKDTALALEFPLTEGTYHIGQGGNHVRMNYHQDYEPQQYALDIVALNSFGVRAKGFYPKNLEQYEIYGHAITSPCEGVVVESKDGLPDLQPPKSDPENATGNYVALTCDWAEDTIIYLEHMQEGSVAVEEGTHVEAGQLLGRVGNTGNTSEPHLHIHAEKDGVGVPLLFDDRFLVRNQIVRNK